MALPHRWPEFQTSRGLHYLALAESRLQAHDHAGALLLLRSGLAKVPADRRGRLLLADLYQRAGRSDLARETLLDGLPHLATDAGYLRSVLTFLQEQRDEAEILRLAASLPAPTPALRALLGLHAAEAACRLDRPDEAEHLLRRHGLLHTSDGARLQAQIDWSRNLPELALNRLHAHLNLHPTDTTALGLLAGYQRALGRSAEWQTSLVALLAADPLAPGPRVAYLHLLDQQGDPTRLEQQIGIFLQHFARRPDALLQLGGFAAETGHPGIARRVRALQPAGSEAHFLAGLLLAEACISAGEHAQAHQLLDELRREHPERARRQPHLLVGLVAVSDYGRHRPDEARLHLDSFLTTPSLPADALVAMARRLDAVGARDAAHRVLEQAAGGEPPDQAALALLIEFALVDDEPAALTRWLERYLRLPRPSRRLLLRVEEVLGSDRHLFLESQAPTLATLHAALERAR